MWPVRRKYDLVIYAEEFTKLLNHKKMEAQTSFSQEATSLFIAFSVALHPLPNLKGLLFSA